ncbi:N-acetyltransferase [Jeotgalibacillus sp. S-D1]|uniref:GNAT family N-acetyltransferase n=1 Tax=Jeotgalibacillus sp. S-D1 TaxID=2552189 RepID=UPI0010594D22|nr:GNAT family protein [Jeotgalibacillus sp. S-D1]TDL31456.1 N-acetyltransferase [Jeotgalibacillus sp. S-D1]
MTTSDVLLRPVKEEDLRELWKHIYQEKSPEWKKWDAPYFPHEQISFETFHKKRESLIDSDDFWAIVVNGEIIGSVSYYWEHKPSQWLEAGIVIYNPGYWNGGYGTEALRQWITRLFTIMPLVRVGYTTWSGNERMIKVGEKLGMKMEARLRKCRYYNGIYYDSIRMGVLREEWKHLEGKNSVNQ